MKPFHLLAVLSALLITATSCEDFLSTGPGKSGRAGTLRWRFQPVTRSAEAFPDTNRFLLSITDEKGLSLYNGTYGASPEFLQVGEGSYTLTVRSDEFSAPAFDRPVYGDTQVAVVRKGAASQVTLSCHMQNAGIRLQVDGSFFRACPRGKLTLSAPDGQLDYDYDESRTAYFHPGNVSLLLTEDGTVRTLFSTTLSAREILTVGLSAPEGTEGGKSGIGTAIAVDTTKTRRSIDWELGSGADGSSPDRALSVPEAQGAAGAVNVWVQGFIVGGDLSSSGSKMNTGPVFEKDTHIAIALRSSVTDKASCLSVELPKGAIRDALNLKDHPGMLGRRILLRGDIVSAYFGIPGLKNVKEYAE